MKWVAGQALLAGCVATSSASAAGFHGSWCGEGIVLHLDAFGVGANEHTFCEATPPPAEAGALYRDTLACKNLYLGDRKADGSVEVTEVPPKTPRNITAIRAGDQLAVHFDAEGEGLLLERCE